MFEILGQAEHLASATVEVTMINEINTNIPIHRLYMQSCMGRPILVCDGVSMGIRVYANRSDMA